MSQVATRLLSLILLMQSRRTWKAAELADELSVSPRTVHRYMGMLEEMGIPIYTERGPYGGFALMRGYRLPPLIFSAEEATVLYMGANLVQELWGETYHDAALGATAKLDNVLPDDLRQEVARRRENLVIGGLTAIDYRPWSTVIDLLRRCIGDRRCVDLTYRAVSGPETQRCVEPYALTLQFGLWYLIGHCQLRNELRTFRVDRIQHASVGGGTYSIPRDFSLEAYLKRGLQAEPVHTVSVRLAPSMAARVREEHGRWMRIEEGPDGEMVAHFHTASLEWATAWVLSLCGDGVVLEPAELREAVRAAAERLHSGHAPPEPS